MKFIAVTQRVDKVNEYSEIRDGLDERWIEFLLECNIIPIIIPNNLQVTKMILKKLKIDGILLTGGDSEIKYGGAFLQRDQVDEFLIEYSIKKQKPILGVCRGMQSILSYFNEKLEKVSNHIGVEHYLCNPYNKEKLRKVNSYHAFSIKYNNKLNENWKINYISEDFTVEGIQHKKFEIYGMMWHPERNKVFEIEDIDIFKSIYEERRCIL